MALGRSDPRLIWLRPHKMMGLELVIPTHWICPYIPPLFACPELARVALFGIAIVCCNTILCPTPITPHLRYLYYLYLLPVTVDHFATRASFHPLWCLHVGGTRGQTPGGLRASPNTSSWRLFVRFACSIDPDDAPLGSSTITTLPSQAIVSNL